MTVRTLIVGDSHDDATFIANIHRFAREHDVTTIIQLGDFGFTFDRNMMDSIYAWLDRDENHRWFWIDGNHDQHDIIEDEILEGILDDNFPLNSPYQIEWDNFEEPVAWRHERMFYCPRGSGTMIGSKKFVFLGGAYSIDRYRRHLGSSYWHQEMVRQSDVDRTIDRWKDQHVDVLISHDVCHNETINRLLKAYDYRVDHCSDNNRTLMTDVVKAIRPHTIYHGHYHYRYTTEEHGAIIQGLAANVDHRGMQNQALHDNNCLIVDF